MKKLLLIFEMTKQLEANFYDSYLAKIYHTSKEVERDMKKAIENYRSSYNLENADDCKTYEN